ncbi:uncharacterized protein G2W53_011861 [Senna tora]|uniref:Uncharacterized protein n=1 Tax=Senna tora TaxID=362788 RepID=A0A834TVX0_9FABA|nr:uncharacterized protein G2W53_011861 [Senna tora]
MKMLMKESPRETCKKLSAVDEG